MPGQFVASYRPRVVAEAGNPLFCQGFDVTWKFGELTPDLPEKHNPVGHYRSLTASRKSAPVS